MYMIDSPCPNGCDLMPRVLSKVLSCALLLAFKLLLTFKLLIAFKLLLAFSPLSHAASSELSAAPYVNLQLNPAFNLFYGNHHPSQECWRAADKQQMLCLFNDNTYLWITLDRYSAELNSSFFSSQTSKPSIEWGSYKKLSQTQFTFSPAYYSQMQHPLLVELQTIHYQVDVLPVEQAAANMSQILLHAAPANHTGIIENPFSELPFERITDQQISIFPWQQLTSSDFGIALVLSGLFLAVEIDFEYQSYLRINQFKFVFSPSSPLPMLD